MARPIRVTVGPLATADDDGISTSQTPSGAGALTITGALASGGVATLDKPRRVILTFAADETGHTFTLAGTDRNGNVTGETIAGTTAGIVQSVLDYKTVTSVTISAAATGAIKVGTNTVASSAIVILNAHGLGPVNFQVDVSGTVNYTASSTDDDLWTLSNIPLATWIDDPTVAAQTTAKQGTYAAKPGATRVTLNSGTGSVTLNVIQAGLAGS